MKGKLAKGEFAVYTEALEEAEVVFRMICFVRGVSDHGLVPKLTKVNDQDSPWRFRVEIEREDASFEPVFTQDHIKVIDQTLGDIAEIFGFEVEEDPHAG
jgi:hypothetical protein